MLVIGLLMVALVCLVLGLVLASSPFLIGSLAASVIAGVVLFRQRDDLSTRPTAKGVGAPKAVSAERQKSLVTGTAFIGRTTADANPVSNVDEAAVAAAPGATTSTDVWVVDGKALFHSASCERIKGLDAEPVPYAQAIEDGFTTCSLCKPRAGVSIRQVWVIDSLPEYHAENCAQLVGADGEQIPRAQAIEDGFRACRKCRPDGPAGADAPVVAANASSGSVGASAQSGAGATALAAGAPEAASRTSQPAPATPHVSTLSDGVWVVDGRPRYHLAGCLLIANEHAEEIPLDQATDDGFMPCSMCEPARV